MASNNKKNCAIFGCHVPSCVHESTINSPNILYLEIFGFERAEAHAGGWANKIHSVLLRFLTVIKFS